MAYIQNKEIFERITKVETEVSSLQSILNEIKDNHLKHLQKDVNDLKIQVNTLTIRLGVAVTVAVFIIEIVTRWLFK